MIVYAEIECMLYNTQSLKEKRSVIKSLITKIRQDFNVSISEIDYQDYWQRTKLGIVIVANSYQYGETVIQEVLKRVDSNVELEQTSTQIERL